MDKMLSTYKMTDYLQLEVCGPLFQKLVAFEAQRVLSMD